MQKWMTIVGLISGAVVVLGMYCITFSSSQFKDFEEEDLEQEEFLRKYNEEKIARKNKKHI